MIGRGAFGAHKWQRVLRALLSVTLLTRAGHAGHAPLVPEPRTILLRDAEPAHMVIGTRQGGYFVTRDAGTTWSWMCEAGVGYDDVEVYPGALLPGGTLVVSTGFGGLAVSADGCGWTPWLPSEQPFVADVRTEPGSPGTVLALEAHSDGAAFVNRLWRSTDDAKTWQALGAPFAVDALASSFAISDEQELYVGVAGPAGAELLRSTDAALSWQRAPLTTELGVTPRVIGARGAPGNAHVFVVADYVQADGTTAGGDRVLLSTDGGQRFSSLLEATGDLSSWALSTDGAHLAVGGHNDGIYSLSDASHVSPSAVMTLVTSLRVHALAWSAQGQLYAAGHEASDGFSVGVSDDEGRTFRGVFALCQVQGPLACAADTSVGRECKSSGETGWDGRKEVAFSDACTESGELVAAAGAGATAVPVGSATPSDDDDSQAPRTAAPTGASREPSQERSGCAFAPAADNRGSSLALSLAMLASVRFSRARRRRSRASCT
jgi:photosystem II stability/assembly factor-like uncharacterized protein